MERIEDGPLGFVRHVGHGLSQDHGTGSDDDGHEEGADLVQVHQAGVGQLEAEECPGQTVEADVDHKSKIRQSEQGGLGVVDGDGLGINLLLGTTFVSAGLLELVPECPEHLVEGSTACAVVTLEEPVVEIVVQYITLQYNTVPVMEVVVLVGLEVVLPATVGGRRTDEQVNAIPPANTFT